MENKAIQLLKDGRQFIDPIMLANGFHWEAGNAGKGSGGFSDSGQYIKGNRRLELHFRYSLGLVTYHIGSLSLSHEEYMRFVTEKGQSHYPGFSSDPLDGFRHLAHDLEKYCSDFLSGSGKEFKKAIEKAKERDELSGFKKLGKE